MKRNLMHALVAVTVAGCLSGSGRAQALDPGTEAPEFELPTLGGGTVALAAHRGKYVVLEWTNYDCPFVKKHYETGRLPALQKKLTGEGVAWLTICSSAPGKQGHFTPEQWTARMQAVQAAPTAVLLDADGVVGRRYEAKNTPYVLVLDPEGKLLYRGGLDDQPGLDRTIMDAAVNYVRKALDEARAGRPVATPTAPPYGCSVKY